MSETEDERIKAYRERDATLAGRMAHAAVDMARGVIGKPPVWQEIRRLEIKQEESKETAQRLEQLEAADLAQSDDAAAYDQAKEAANEWSYEDRQEWLAGEPAYLAEGRIIDPPWERSASEEDEQSGNARVWDRQFSPSAPSGQAADRLAAEMVRGADRGGGPEIEDNGKSRGIGR